MNQDKRRALLLAKIRGWKRNDAAGYDALIELLEEIEAFLDSTARCEFCGSKKHTVDGCHLPGARSYRAERSKGGRI